MLRYVESYVINLTHVKPLFCAVITLLCAGKHIHSCIFFYLGHLQPGDQILEVNGESLIGVTSERCISF